MSEGVKVLHLDSPALPQELKSEAMALASDARGTLGHHIHGEARRRALFGPRLRPGQFIVALVDGSIAGMACFKCRGPGPVAPRLVDFVKTLGLAGVHHWVMFKYIQLRIGRDGLYIVGIDVFDGFHRRGVGSALIDELCRIAWRHGVDLIETDVRAGNENAHKFYRRAGFAPAQFPRFSLGWLIMMTNGIYTRVRLPLASHKPSSPARPGTP
jgi:ribosomal protein S18 acetylase RimI-like enzyme